MHDIDAGNESAREAPESTRTLGSQPSASHARTVSAAVATRGPVETRPVAGATRTRHAPLSAGEHRRLARRLRVRRELLGWLFLAPAVVSFVLFLLIPAVGVLWWSMREGGITGGSEFVGFDNWLNLAQNQPALRAVYNTIAFALMSIPAILVLSLLVALLMQRLSRGASVYRFLLYLPVLVPGVVAGLIWIFITHTDFGLLNMTFRALGLPAQNWLGVGTALPVLAAIDIWRSVGYWAIFFLAMLIGMPRELYEAAHLDGAGPWQRFRRLTLPQLRPIFVFALVMATIWGLQIFDTVWVMTRGGPGTATVTMVFYVFQSVFTQNSVGYGAAIAVVLLAGILVLTLTQFRALQGRPR
jgi:ABC-type sugar transport system permease subunit